MTCTKRTFIAAALAMVVINAAASDYWGWGASTNSDHIYAMVGDGDDPDVGSLSVWFDPKEGCEPIIEHAVTVEAIASDSLLASWTGARKRDALGQSIAADLPVDAQLRQQIESERFEDSNGRYAIYRLEGDTSEVFRQLRSGNRVTVHFPATSESYGYSLNRSRAALDVAESNCRKLMGSGS